MPDTRKPTPLTRTSTRHQGRRMSKPEREQAQETFLTAYQLNGNIMLSCRRANIDRSTFYQWMEHDETFSIECRQAEKDFADLALAEFRKRAMEGYEKPVISMGRMVFEETPILNNDGTPKLDSKDHPMMKRGKPLTERVVSDNLLAMLVKRHFPEFRDKQQVELTGSNGGPVQFQHLHNLTEQELDTLERIAREAQEREQASGR
jgi:hypothetical protein